MFFGIIFHNYSVKTILSGFFEKKNGKNRKYQEKT
jgi:hypothetical protein